MHVSQEDFERVTEHCTAQLAEHGRDVDDQLDALGLDADGIATIAEAVVWDGIDTPAGIRSAAAALRFGILIGIQLRREGLLGAEI